MNGCTRESRWSVVHGQLPVTSAFWLAVRLECVLLEEGGLRQPRARLHPRAPWSPAATLSSHNTERRNTAAGHPVWSSPWHSHTYYIILQHMTHERTLTKNVFLFVMLKVNLKFSSKLIDKHVRGSFLIKEPTFRGINRQEIKYNDWMNE